MSEFCVFISTILLMNNSAIYNGHQIMYSPQYSIRDMNKVFQLASVINPKESVIILKSTIEVEVLYST